MAESKKMTFETEDNTVVVSLPLTSQGKFRCKNRDGIQRFGKGFAPTKNGFSNNSYLEWQIGYDTVIGKKETGLAEADFEFTGANKKKKYPYELSEIVFEMCKIGIITKKELEDLHKRVGEIKDFLQDKYKIEPEPEDEKTLNGVSFLSSSTKLPTFIKESKNSKLFIEIMIQKQQYATGVQPMVYLIAPVDAFSNKEDIINHTSKQTPRGTVVFDKSSKDFIFNLILCFGMCSNSHNHDIKEILNVIIKKLGKKA